MTQLRSAVVWLLLFFVARPLGAVEPARRSQKTEGAGPSQPGQQGARLAVLHDGTVQSVAGSPSDRAAAIRREPQGASHHAASASFDEESQQHLDDDGQPYGRPPQHPQQPPPPPPRYGPPPREPHPYRGRPVAAAPHPHAGPQEMNDAERKLARYDRIVAEAEDRAGIPPTSTTTAPVEEGSSGFLKLVCVLAVAFGVAAIAYSFHLSKKTQETEALLLKQQQQQMPQQRLPPQAWQAQGQVQGQPQPQPQAQGLPGVQAQASAQQQAPSFKGNGG